MVQFQLVGVGRGSCSLILPFPSTSPLLLRNSAFWRFRFYCCGQTRNKNEEHNIERPSTLVMKLLDRNWMLPQPDVLIHQISCVHQSSSTFKNNTTPSFTQPLPSSFYVIRDDLLHPVSNGNKARKLDAILPILQEHSITDVVTCGGCQSAHTAATAVSCAERGIRSHLLIRGEQPRTPTGYNLISLMYGNVIYVPRSLYAKREQMLMEHANLIAGTHGSVQFVDEILNVSALDHQIACKLAVPQSVDPRRKVVIVNEGAGGTAALLGIIRLVKYLSQPHLFGTSDPITIISDAGTGTTATGMGLGVKCLGLKWEIVAVMLADTIEGYKEQEKRLISDFKRNCGLESGLDLRGCDEDVVQWVQRTHMRKFGNVLEGEIDLCQKIAQQTGILLDPIYTLAAWEHAVLKANSGSTKVVMLHTGGTLGMFGVAQRYKSLAFSSKS